MTWTPERHAAALERIVAALCETAYHRDPMAVAQALAPTLPLPAPDEPEHLGPIRDLVWCLLGLLLGAIESEAIDAPDWLRDQGLRAAHLATGSQ